MSATDAPGMGIGTYDVDPPRCQAAVATALRLGYRHVDTAELYENERAVGAALEATSVAGTATDDRRPAVDPDDVFVATKVHSANLAYEDVIAAAERSRERLGVERIDCLYVHWPIRAYDPAETLAAFDELVDRGSIRHVGLSNFTPAMLEEALDHLEAPLYAHQVECHPLLQQDELRELARSTGHHLVAYSPLAKGAVHDVPVVREIAAKHGATPAQVSLAWALAQDGVVPIPKSTSRRHLRENLAARALTLDSDDLARLDAIEAERRCVDFPDAPWNAT